MIDAVTTPGTRQCEKRESRRVWTRRLQVVLGGRSQAQCFDKARSI